MMKTMEKEEIKKAGCILIDFNSEKIALIFRENRNDYSFPKGHCEKGESLVETALRETAEETKRDAKLLSEIPAVIEHYVDSVGDKCVCHYFLAKDIGKSDNTCTDTHTLIWTDIEKVEEILTYSTQKKWWEKIKSQVNQTLKNKQCDVKTTEMWNI